MTNEERDLIAQFIQRVGGPAAGGFAGSVPATNAAPPVDREADAWLAELFQRFPEARYRVSQYAFVQEHALAQAQATIRALQAQLTQAQPQAQPAPSPWGAAARGPAPAPFAPAYPQAPFAQQGPGFFGSALRTAAGVAGGIFAADALMSMFGGHGGGFGAGGFGSGNTTIIENNYGNGPWDAPSGDPGWTDPAADNTTPDMDTDPGGFDNDPNSI